MTFPHGMTKQGFLTEKYSINEDSQKTKVTSGNWQCWKLQYRLNKHTRLHLIIKIFLGQTKKVASSPWPTTLNPESKKNIASLGCYKRKKKLKKTQVSVISSKLHCSNP